MTTDKLITYFRAYLGDQSGRRWKRETVVLWLNKAQQDLKKDVDEVDEGFFRAAVEYAVVAAPGDSYEFDLPSDFEAVKTVEREVTGGPPVPGERATFATRHEYFGYDWEPVYYLEGMKLGIVDPHESYTLRVYYSKLLPDLEEDQDVSLIPVGFHTLIALTAARLALGSEGNSLPDSLESEYQRDLTMLRTTLDSRRKQKPRYVHHVAP